ncbi:MAG: type II toxin-antitoxin system PemK/MazF family toxin [Mycobacteriales bacterium]
MRRGEVWDVDFPAPAGRRPAVLLTRDVILDRVRNVTVAPVTSTTRGIPTEVQIDQRAGLDHLSAVSCDNVTTVPKRLCVRRRGSVDPATERKIAVTVGLALDLD